MNLPEFEPAVHKKLDLFPAQVGRLIGDLGQENPQYEVIFSETRTIVTNDYIYVILDSTDGPYFAIKEQLVDFHLIARQGYRVLSESTEYFIQRDGNCGCGSRLRGMRFLAGVPYMSRSALKKG